MTHCVTCVSAHTVLQSRVVKYLLKADIADLKMYNSLSQALQQLTLQGQFLSFSVCRVGAQPLTCQVVVDMV